MSKEYKAELKSLLKSKKQLEKDAATVHRECKREINYARRTLIKVEKDAKTDKDEKEIQSSLCALGEKRASSGGDCLGCDEVSQYSR